jgi:hypothetical protein
MLMRIVKLSVVAIILRTLLSSISLHRTALTDERSCYYHRLYHCSINVISTTTPHLIASPSSRAGFVRVISWRDSRGTSILGYAVGNLFAASIQ